MIGNPACSIKEMTKNDPRFQEVMSWYEDPNTKWIRVDMDLRKYREKNDKTVDWYPSAEDREAFMSFVSYSRMQALRDNRKKQRIENSKPLRATSEVYKDMIKLGYSRPQLESRLDLLKINFANAIDGAMRKAKEKTGKDITAEQAVRRLGGYKNIMQKIFDALAKATPETEYRYLEYVMRPRTEEDKAFLRERAEYTAKEIQKLVENKNRFAALAARTIGDSFGLVVDHNGVEMDLRARRDNEDDNDAKKEDIGSSGDRYIDTRTLEILSTIGTETKSFISTIPITDNRGRIQRNDLMRIQYLEPGQIAYILPTILRFSTPESMIADIREASDRYPFLTNLADKLEGKYNPNDKNYQALVYTNFKRAANLYGYVSFDKGSYHAEKANTKAQGNSLIRNASVNVNGAVLGGDWSIYDTSGNIVSDIGSVSDTVISELESIKNTLGFVNTMRGGYERRRAVNKNNEATHYKDFTLYSDYAVQNGGEAAIKKFLKDYPDTVAKITKAARGIGLDLSEAQVEDALSAPVNKTTASILGQVKSDNHAGGNRLTAIVNALSSVYSTAAKTTDKDSGQYQYKTARQVLDVTTKELSKLNSAFAVSFFDELEPRVLVGNASLQTNVYPSLLKDTMDLVNNEMRLDDTDYQRVIENEFGAYEGYKLNGAYTGWLKNLTSGSAFTFEGDEGVSTGPYKVVHMTEFNHVDYQHLSVPQKIAAQLTMWGGMNGAVEVPIQSDYTEAWDFIQNAGIKSGFTTSDLDKITRKQFDAEAAQYIAENGKKMSFAEMGNVFSRISRDVFDQYGQVNEEWPVVQAVADEVMIEINRINKLSQEVADDPKGLKGPRMKVLDRMGRKFQIFPEFNNNGFLKEYNSKKNDTEARDFVVQKVTEQLQNIVTKDFKYLTKSKALANPILENLKIGGKTINLFREDGNADALSAEGKITLQNFFLDYFYGRLQMTKLLNGGLQNFEGLLDYEKRNMMQHAMRRPVYTKAVWNGEMVGRENQRAVYLEDEKSTSFYYNDIKDLLTGLKDEGYITEGQLPRMLGSYENTKSTDGQGFRFYESYRVVQIELGKWNEGREKVYDYLVNGRGNVSKEEIAKEMQTIYNPNEKPVYTGWEIVGGRKVPVLHKYSETVLFPEKVYRKLLGDNVPIQLLGMAKAAEQLNSKAKPFDIFLMSSCVKVGGHTIINPFGFQSEEYVDDKGETKTRLVLDDDGDPIRNCHTDNDVARFILDHVKSAPWAVHVLPMKYYGEAASTPAHGEDDEISWSSQAEKDLWGNVVDDETRTDEIVVNGNKMSAARARTIYDSIDAATVAAKYKQVQELFENPDELRDVLLSELAGKPYSSPELEFAISSGKVPYFYPSIASGAEQLMSSILKKRLTRPKTKGANLLQVTSLGYDMDPFGESYGLDDSHKLKLEFEGEGENKRLKYVECYLPIFDSRLEIFADENGAITPERLAELVEQKIIPEDLIQFVAYRTPSDDLHSIIPLRVKGFISKTLGANIIVPKEIMNMTGHDFDGDKLRCHFQDFKLSVDEEEVYEEFLKQVEDKDNIIKAMLGQDDVALASFNKFKREWLKDSSNYREGTIQMYQFDYDASASSQSQQARDNAKVQLAFAQLTSPAGSRRLFIPGGSAETDVLGATFHIYRSIKQNPNLQDRLSGWGLDFSSDYGLYESLKALGGVKLNQIMNIVNDDVTPYTFAHSNEAFNYMIGGKRMISIYALYASAGQMLQRLGLEVQPIVYKNEKTGKVRKYTVGFFGKEIKELYNVKNNVGQLGSLTESELVNSAVDNGKNPRLGYLNQDPKLAEITNYLIAANYSAEQVHLILNQPVVVEALRIMKETNQPFGMAIAESYMNLIANEKEAMQYGSLSAASKAVMRMDEQEYVTMLPYSYDDIRNGKDADLRYAQIGIGKVLTSQSKYARLLSEFIKGTRPEAASDGIGTRLARTQVILNKLNDLRSAVLSAELEAEEQEDVALDANGDAFDTKELITGMADVIRPVEVFANDSAEEIAEKVSQASPLQRVTALEATLQDKVLNMFAQYFPQAKATWRAVSDDILSRYKASDREMEAIARGIGNEMILWNLLKSSAFVTDVEGEAKDILIEMPRQLMLLKKRIADEKKLFDKGEPAMDKVARSLIDNTFLKKLTVDPPETTSEKPRISFQKGGVKMDRYAQKVAYDWAMLSVSPYEEVRRFATDLYKYNAFSSGFGFGMYEYAHFAPYTVLEEVKGYMDSLSSMQQASLFTESKEDALNFFHQYYLNHWGDERLVPSFEEKEIPNALRNSFGLKPLSEKDEKKARKVFGLINDKLYIVLKRSGEKQLYRLDRAENGREYDAVLMPKLGVRTKRNQVFVQYNPQQDAEQMEPYQIGEDSNWETKLQSLERQMQDNNIEATDNTMSESDYQDWTDSITSEDERPRRAVKHYGKEVESAAATASAALTETVRNVLRNQEALRKQQEAEARVSETEQGAQTVLEATATLGTLGEQKIETGPASTGGFSVIQSDADEFSGGAEMELAYLTRIEVDENGNERVVTRTANWTPDVVRQTREQRAYVELNRRLREEILPIIKVGVAPLTHADAMMRLQGVTDFSKATQVTAAGLRELIRISEGYRGEEALPEEFAHVALEMLGHEHPLVQRLLNQLASNDRAVREAFEGQYDEYRELYKNDEDKLRLEAAGKLLAKSLLREIPIDTPEVKPLVRRIVDAIKEMFRQIGSWRIWDAILGANHVASNLARDILSGRILDDMSFENISTKESFARVQKDLTDKQGILQNILKRETKRLALLNKRVGPVDQEHKTAAQLATEKQIVLLEDAIRNHKVESALYDYLSSSLAFLKDTEASLDRKVSNGDKVNTVCRELNKVRDTLYSYASVMDLVDKAVESGEVVMPRELTDITKEVKAEIDKFFTKYNNLGMRFFERMLANVYGEHGVTRTLGRHKGETLSIEEMARHGERDISLVTRLLSSLADYGDYVLAAFDDVTRRAKMTGRQRAEAAHRRIVVAFDKLVAATGSKDQSFMFEKVRGEDGKMHNTGKYLSDEAAKKLLSPAQYAFYSELMSIKKDIDECLPPVLIKNPNQIVALRKFGFDRIKSAEGIHGKLTAFGENVKNAILDNSDEADKEERTAEADFQNNKIDTLPIKYVTKGKHESWDDMTDDVAMSVAAYATMGYEYDELNQVMAMLENARYMSMNRDIEQSSGGQRLIERVVTGKTDEDFYYEQPLTKKQMNTNLQLALNDFFQMHLYGKLQKEEGGLLGTKISARKAANFANAAASYSQMAFNLQQRISNIGAGMMNIAVETAGKGVFNAADFAWATRQYSHHTARRILDTGKLESSNKLSLFAEKFDLHQNNGKTKASSSFKKGYLSRIVNTNLLFAGLNAGEDFLALTTALAITRNVKVKNAEGKTETLWDAYEVKFLDKENKKGAYLQVKPGYKMADGSEINKEVEDKYAKLVIGTNFRLQGIYNSDDKSAIQQYAFGSLVMMYRKWIHPALVRRYGKAGYNPLTGAEGEGYWRTTGRWLWESVKDAYEDTITDEEGTQIAFNIIRYTKNVFASFRLNKSKLTGYEKSNLARASVEISTLLGVCLALMLSSKFMPEKDKDKEQDFSGWFTSMAVYQLFRLRNEVGAVAPSPLIVREIKNTLSSPLAAVDPMIKLLQIPLLLWPGTWMTEVKSGTYKGHSQAYKIIFQQPILSVAKQVHHVLDPTPLINYYKNDNIY